MIRGSRIGIVHLTLAIFALCLLGKSAQVQLIQSRLWRVKAAKQQYRVRELPAARGAIVDATGMTLAQSHEMIRLEIAPREVQDFRAITRVLTAARVPAQVIRRTIDRRRLWTLVPGRYLAAEVAPLLSLRGVYATPVMVRSYSMSDGTRGVVGNVDANGRGVDGIELALDSMLRGVPGQSVVEKDATGRSVASPATLGIPPRSGATVVLTLNHELQEIAERALCDAVAQMGALGGDIVVLDPHTGEVLALASRQSDRSAATVLTDPFEPGSTMKPFMAAALLEHHRVSERDSVDTESGEIEVSGRTIHDEHRVGRAPLTDVLQWSSNIGIVKFSQRLTPREQFETLRDFGFGSPTGISVPAEASGTLREPRRWSLQSPASIAMGYEVAATPLQLALAYAVFANGGALLEPTLIKEVHAANGALLYRHEPRVVRQVVRADVAERLRAMLLGVVEGGTALQADLSNYLLAGKTGTPRRVVNGQYAAMQYNPNFVGLFPADAPQYVLVVKLTIPQGKFYAAETAAPLTRTVLQAAIAARNAALDRTKLETSLRFAAESRGSVQSLQPLPHDRTPSDAPAAPHAISRTSDSENVPYLVTLPTRSSSPAEREPPRPVPAVRGLPVRDAVRSLHSAGFRVQLVPGIDGRTFPDSGELALPGALVRLGHDH